MRDALLELVPVRAALAVVEAPQLREVRVLRRQHALVLVLDQLAGEVVQLCNSVENKYFFLLPRIFLCLLYLLARRSACWGRRRRAP